MNLKQSLEALKILRNGGIKCLFFRTHSVESDGFDIDIVGFHTLLYWMISPIKPLHILSM